MTATIPLASCRLTRGVPLVPEPFHRLRIPSDIPAQHNATGRCVLFVAARSHVSGHAV